SYKLRVPPRMNLDLRVSAGNAQGVIEPVTAPQAPLEPGQTITRDFTVKRIPRTPHQEIISGRVVDEQGNNVPDANVFLGNTLLPTLTQAERDTEEITWTGSGNVITTKSHPEGFVFSSLQAGTADLWAFEPAKGWGAADRVKTGTRDVVIRLVNRP